jgi:hypothetical protein
MQGLPRYEICRVYCAECRQFALLRTDGSKACCDAVVELNDQIAAYFMHEQEAAEQRAMRRGRFLKRKKKQGEQYGAAIAASVLEA